MIRTPPFIRSLIRYVKLAVDDTAAPIVDAVAQFQRSLIAQVEALVAAWRAALPQCFDADGNLLDNWQDILANPLDPLRG